MAKRTLRCFYSRHSITVISFVSVVLFIIWAWQTPIDIFVRGVGKVTSHSDNKVIEHLEGGILTHIYVTEGQPVKRGMLLFVVDNPSLMESIKVLEERLSDKQTRAKRLLAEMNGTDFSLLSNSSLNSLPNSKDSGLADIESGYFSNELNLFRRRKESLSEQQLIIEQKMIKEKARYQEMQQTIKDLNNELVLARKQRDIFERLFKDRAGSMHDLLEKRMMALRIQNRINQTQSKLPVIDAGLGELKLQKKQLKANFREQVQDEYNKEVADIAQLQEQLSASRQRTLRREIRSPVKGNVHKLHTSTVGEVVSPGAVMAEIVPENEPLLIEAQIAPYDRARIWEDQTVNLRVSAYDYSIYGTLTGHIKEISADTYQFEQSSSYFYQVMITVDKSGFGVDKPLMQGMTVDINIVSGKQSILTYLLPPAFSSAL